jgi:hypothetical protein
MRIYININIYIYSYPYIHKYTFLCSYHPTHRRDIPTKVKRILWGSNFSVPKPFLLPITITVARPLTPELIWTTLPVKIIVRKYNLAYVQIFMSFTNVRYLMDNANCLYIYIFIYICIYIHILHEYMYMYVYMCIQCILL